MSSFRSSAVLRRQKDQRRGIRFTMMIVGPSGTGKTTFINTLLDQDILPSKFHYSNLAEGQSIPQTITYSNLSDSVLNAMELEYKFDPSVANQEPGIAITETSVEIVDEDDSKLLLSVIDTPGFGDNLNNEICCDELVHFLEQQFDSVLAEETRVRRNPRFEDTRVHVCLYFITPTGHGLRELDVETMKKLSKYVNIIPIISKADSFTKTELMTFKRNIRDDIERFNIPIYQFSIDDEAEDEGDEYNGFEQESKSRSDDDLDIIEENKYLNNLQPFAVITSTDKIELEDGTTKRVRKYPWGEIDINNTEFSDFPVLKSVLFGSHLQELKDITHDYLYESYRTERLLGVSELQELDDASVYQDNTRNSTMNTTIKQSQLPSMSNLADIANSKSMMNFGKPIPEGDENDGKLHSMKDTESLSSKMSGLTVASNHANGNGTSNGVTSSPVPNKVKSMLIDDSSVSSVKKHELEKPVTNEDLIKTRPDDNYSFQNDEDLSKEFQTEKPLIAPSTPNSRHNSTVGGSPSLMESVNYSPVNKQQIRKISETIPYYLKHENIRNKQLKLQELEKKAALELSKRAADLERKAMELKIREKQLKLELSKRESSLNYNQSVPVAVADTTTGTEKVDEE